MKKAKLSSTALKFADVVAYENAVGRWMLEKTGELLAEAAVDKTEARARGALMLAQLASSSLVEENWLKNVDGGPLRALAGLVGAVSVTEVDALLENRKAIANVLQAASKLPADGNVVVGTGKQEIAFRRRFSAFCQELDLSPDDFLR